jgi:hypothetical protein
MGGATLPAGNTPVSVLAPSIGRTKTGRLWTYVRDECGCPLPFSRRARMRTTGRGPTVLSAFLRWLDATLPKLSRRSELAVPIRYAMSRLRMGCRM